MRFGFLLVITAIGVFGSIVSNSSSHSPKSSDEILRAQETQRRHPAEGAAEDPNDNHVEDGVELHRDPNGHFYADVQVNGSTLHMLVDTGASDIALSREDARSAGLATSIGMHEVIGRGADGDVHGEMARLDRVSLGQKTVEGLPAVVLNSGKQSLLGQSFLSTLDKVEIEGDKMLLR